MVTSQTFSMQKKSFLLGLCAWSMVTLSTFAQPGLWNHLPQLPDRAAADVWVRPPKAHVVEFNAAAAKGLLNRAPKEGPRAEMVNPAEISLPMPDGTLARFKFVEASIMEPELAQKFPEIKTYRGEGIDDPAATVRFDLTPAGFHAQILSPHGAVYIDPAFRHDDKTHVSYYKRDYRKAADGFQCLVAGPDQPVAENATRGELLRSGSQLRTYRLACGATGEYVAFHGGTVSAGMAAIVTAVNRVDGVYEQELAIRMVLVANNNLVVYTNASSDPYSNTSGSTMLGQNQSTLDSIIGSANYDIGHVFSTGGGGIAGLGVVCVSNNKARGVTGLTAPTGDAFYIDYVAHEMGHQFGGNHTFNSVQGSCGGGNRNASTAYEVGSGTTIMAYAGICGVDDLQPHSDPYFHSISFDEIINFSTAGSGNSCAVVTATTNNAPTVSAGANYTIPISTPFTLTASGSDPNGDPLTYCWEERDLGASQLLTDADNGTSPLFRSFNPTTSSSRTFPDLTAILSNTSSLGEKLPTTTRTMSFRVTARDNRMGGGGVNTSDMIVSVNSAAGPFVVTAPNTGVTWSGLRTVTWNVAGTTASPVSAANVNILLSTDGGLTFPTVLATNVPNDGSHTVTLPNISSSTARIKVEATGNIFFDISDVNFSITTFVPSPLIIADTAMVLTEGCTPTNNAVDPGESVTVNFALKNVGTANATNISATLLAAGGVNSPSGSQIYGGLVANGAAVAQAFSFLANGTCGGTVAAVFQVFEGTNFLGNVTNFVPLGALTVNTTTNSNNTAITIPSSGNSGPASLYPSTISISGMSGNVSKVIVKLNGITHANPDDMDVLLVAPNGQTVLLMSDVGGANSLSGVNLTFDDTAGTSLPDSSQIVSGTFLPSNVGAGDAFTSPAPGGSYGAAMSALNGGNPNGTWSLYVSDDASPNKGSMTGWTLILSSSSYACCSFNTAPTISSIGDQTINEDTSTGSLAFTVNDGESAAGSLLVTASSSNTNLVTNNRLVLGGSNANRTLSITPNTNQFGASTITLTVSDGQLSNSTAFLLTVNSVNDAPVLTTISNRTIVEGSTLSFTNTATDVDTLSSQFSYSLGSNAPAGAVISSNGVFTWTPGESQGPSTNLIGVIVSDNGSPNMTDTKTFTVIVTETNAAPILSTIANRTVHAGTTVIFTNTATDVDIPTNLLSFSLTGTPAAGATINASSGVFNWTPSDTQLGTNSFNVQVNDNGTPNLTDVKSFNVDVQPYPLLSILSVTSTNIVLSWTSISGQNYLLQSKTNLNDPVWNGVTNVTASGNSASASDSLGETEKFYRLQLP